MTDQATIPAAAPTAQTDLSGPGVTSTPDATKAPDPAAPPPAEGEAAATPPAPVEPPPPAESAPNLREHLSALAAVAKAKLAETRRLKAEREGLKAERGQLQTKSSAAEAALKENADYKAKLERVAKSPQAALEFLKAQGVKPEHLIDAAVKAGTPEAAVAAARLEAEEARAADAARIAALEAKIEELANGRKQSEEEAKAQQAAIVRQQAEHQFLSMVQSKSDKYEALIHLYSPEEVKAQALDVVKTALSKGHTGYTDEEIADYLEERARPRYDAIRQRAVDKRASGSAPTGQGTAEAPRTLTNTMGTERSAQKLDPSTLPPDEQIRYWAAEYDRLASKGAPKP